MASEQQNPFRIGERVSGYSFADREEEVARVRAAMLSASSLLVYGPRRMGKSSMIFNAAESARTARPKPIVVSADVATATNLFDVSARLLRSLYLETRWLKLRLEDLLGGLAPRVTVKLDEHGGPPSITFGIDRRTAGEEERRRAFEGVFERLSQVRESTGRPVAVVLDEFQAVRSFAGESSEWHLRDVMQRHGDLAWVCAGSQESLIHGMIGPDRAFYKMFDLLHLGPIDEQVFADWIEERLARGSGVAPGVGLELVRMAGPRTQDVVQVARQLYFRGLAAGRRVEVADAQAALDEVVRSEAPLLRSLWSELSAQQQDVLRVVSLGVERLYSAEVRDQYGLPGASSVHKAVETLVARGLLVREGSGVAFDSPFFRRWVRTEVASDLG
ncbi:MAG TPA: ATP-binding protein [Trueperaceae bacterium]|nr:ATP-binding protein [Trueperaceae bacterium]